MPASLATAAAFSSHTIKPDLSMHAAARTVGEATIAEYHLGTSVKPQGQEGGPKYPEFWRFAI